MSKTNETRIEFGGRWKLVGIKQADGWILIAAATNLHNGGAAPMTLRQLKRRAATLLAYEQM